MFTPMLLASLFILSFCTISALAQGVNHANIHRGWHKGQGPYFCGSDADGDGTELLAAVLGPQCGATIWVKNTGIFGTSVNNGIGNCIQAKLVDQEGGGAVDLNPAAWAALTTSPEGVTTPDGQVSVEWGYGSCASGGKSPTPGPDTSSAPPSSGQQDNSTSGSDHTDQSTGDQQDHSTGDQQDQSTKDQEDQSTSNQRDSSTSDQKDQSTKDQVDQSTSNQKDSSTSDQPTSDKTCSVPAHDQCGGRDFSGCTTCADGLQCTLVNEWWSGCEPGGAISRVRRGIVGVLHR
ncbi:hypothetical protein XPA_009688 [Xanthoria parietina]